MIKSLTGIAIGTLLCTVASAQTIEDRVRELERRVQQLEKVDNTTAVILSNTAGNMSLRTMLLP